MSAPAVPTARDNSAPTTHIDSTQEAPHGQSVSGIGHGGAGPEEAMLHTGAFNNLDMALRMQFISLASFKWDVQQGPGTLLWSAPITPRNSHQFIRHLSQMYNTWVGGFDYNIKVCGTGFHAGVLAIVRLPPNISPSSIASPTDFTAFEYVLIDPKTLEVVTEHIIDQRNIMYHYTTDTGRDSFGGHIAVYVYAPLATSSTGATNISVVVLTRPSPDFAFFQIKPLEGKGPEPEPDEPRAIADALYVGDDCLNSTATFTDEVENFVVIPKAQRNPLASQLGCYRFDGTIIRTASRLTFPLKTMFRSKVSVKDSVATIDALMGLPQASTINMKITMTRASGSSLETYTCTSMPADSQFKVITTDRTNDNGIIEITSYYEAKQVVPQIPSEESFFVVDNHGTVGDQQRFSYQTRALANLLKSKQYIDLMTKQDAVIIDMYDAELDTPIRRLKLYWNGHISTKGEEDQIKLPARKYYFKFVQISRASEPIPAPPKTYLMNEFASRWRAGSIKQKEVTQLWQEQSQQ